jgi:hypothetical protein
VLVGQRLLTGGDVPAFSAVERCWIADARGTTSTSDLPLSCQVEALYALVQACLRASEPAAMGQEDISATALRLFLEGSKSPPVRALA